MWASGSGRYHQLRGSHRRGVGLQLQSFHHWADAVFFDHWHQEFGPEALRQVVTASVPANAILGSAALIAIAVLLNIFLPSAVFTLISSVATTSFLFVWGMIILAHIRYRQQNPHPQGYVAPFYPVGDYLVLLFFVAVAIIMLMSKTTAIPALLAAAWVILISLGRFWHDRRERKGPLHG